MVSSVVEPAPCHSPLTLNGSTMSGPSIHVPSDSDLCDVDAPFALRDSRSSRVVAELLAMLGAANGSSGASQVADLSATAVVAMLEETARMWEMRTGEIHGPADEPFVHLARTAAMSFASQAGLRIDPCDELRIAVDEACKMLIDLEAS